MAQKIVTLCDPHLADSDLEVPGSSWSVTIQQPGGKPSSYTLDVCEEHAKPLAELGAYLAELGRPKTAPGAKPATLADESDRTCKLCGFVSGTRQALSSHVRGQHHMTLRESEGKPRRGAPKEAS